MTATVDVAACDVCGTVDAVGPHTQSNCIGVLRSQLAAAEARAQADRQASYDAGYDFATKQAAEALVAMREAGRVEHERAESLQDRLADVTEERDAAQKNYRFMVERAADEKLDGYRELAAKLCAAESRATALADLAARIPCADNPHGLTYECNAQRLCWACEMRHEFAALGGGK